MPSHRGWGKSAENKGPHPDLRSLRSPNPTSPAKAEEVKGQVALTAPS